MRLRSSSTSYRASSTTRSTRATPPSSSPTRAAALDGTTVVGMASALHYIHPGKPPELYINEVGLAPAYRNQAIGRALLKVLFAHGRTLGCTEAWLGTDKENAAARRMYAAAGGKEEDEETVIVWFDLEDV